MKFSSNNPMGSFIIPINNTRTPLYFYIPLKENIFYQHRNEDKTIQIFQLNLQNLSNLQLNKKILLRVTNIKNFSAQYLTWHIFSLMRNEKFGNSSIVFENIRVHKHLRISVESKTSITSANRLNLKSI